MYTVKIRQPYCLSLERGRGPTSISNSAYFYEQWFAADYEYMFLVGHIPVISWFIMNWAQ